MNYFEGSAIGAGLSCFTTQFDPYGSVVNVYSKPAAGLRLQTPLKFEEIRGSLLQPANAAIRKLCRKMREEDAFFTT